MIDLDKSLRTGKKAPFDQAVRNYTGAFVLWRRAVVGINRVRKAAHLPPVT